MGDTKEILVDKIIPSLTELGDFALELTEKKVLYANDTHKLSLLYSLLEIWEEYKDKPSVVINDIFSSDKEKSKNITSSHASQSQLSHSSFVTPKHEQKIEYETDDESLYSEPVITDDLEKQLSEQELKLYKQEKGRLNAHLKKITAVHRSLADDKGLLFVKEKLTTQIDDVTDTRNSSVTKVRIVSKDSIKDEYKRKKIKIIIPQHTMYRGTNPAMQQEPLHAGRTYWARKNHMHAQPNNAYDSFYG